MRCGMCAPVGALALQRCACPAAGARCWSGPSLPVLPPPRHQQPAHCRSQSRYIQSRTHKYPLMRIHTHKQAHAQTCTLTADKPSPPCDASGFTPPAWPVMTDDSPIHRPLAATKFDKKIQRLFKVCMHFKRTGAAARESLWRKFNHPGGLTSPAFHACCSARPFHE